MTARKAATNAERQRAYRKRTAAMVRVPLDQAQAEQLAAILADTGENAAEWVRRTIREQARKERPRRSGASEPYRGMTAQCPVHR